MPWALAVGAAVGGLGSAYAGKQAAEGASSAAAAQQAAVAEQRRQFDEMMRRQEPWIQAGEQALGQYQGILEDPTAIYQDPGYLALLAQGQQTVEGSAAARGMGLSGRTLEELAMQGQRTAAGYRSQVLGELGALAGIGQQSLGQQAQLGAIGAQAGMQGATNLANIYQQGAAAQAAGTMGAVGALQGGLQNYWLGQQLNQGA